MTLEEGLVAELIADAAVFAIVGNRIHPEIVPQQGTRPAIVYLRIGTTREQQLSGPADLILVRMRLDMWHSDPGACWSLANAVRSLLNIGPAATLGTFAVQQVYLDEEFPLSDFEGDRRDYRVSQEYVIMHAEV